MTWSDFWNYDPTRGKSVSDLYGVDIPSYSSGFSDEQKDAMNELIHDRVEQRLNDYATGKRRELFEGQAEMLYERLYGKTADKTKGNTPENVYYYDTPAAQKINYQDAPLAELYGMDATTAYQEALANTSVQRRMRDLQSAGLNPVLSLRGSGADGVSGAALAASGGDGSYSSGGSSASGGSSVFRDVLKTIREVANTAASIGRLFR